MSRIFVQVEYAICGKKPHEGYYTRLVFNPLGAEGFLLLENEDENTEVYIQMSKVLNVAQMKMPKED